MPLPTYPDLVRRFGLAFRPDLPAFAYGEHPNAYRTPVDREIHDGVVRTEFANYERGAIGDVDPFAAALAIWQQDGLLGANDPGPPAFRAAHEAYLVRRASIEKVVVTPEMAQEILDADQKARRPRVPLPALLDAVDRFRAETHPLALLGLPPDKDMATEARAARDTLVAWFAERGVDVEP